MGTGAVEHSVDGEQTARVGYAGEGTRCRGCGLPFMTKAIFVMSFAKLA